MNCHNCGSEIKEGSKFCNSCGTPISQQVNTVESQPIPTPASQQEFVQPKNNAYTQPAPKKSNGGIIAVIIILLLVIAALVVYIFFFNGKKDDSSSAKSDSSSIVTTTQTEAATTTTTAETEATTTTTTTTQPAETTTTAAPVETPTGEYAEMVLGKWNGYAMIQDGTTTLISDLQEQVDNGEVDFDMAQVEMNFEFNEDGTFSAYTYTTGTIEGSWTMSGDSIIIADPDGSNPIDEGDIVYDPDTDSISVVMTDTQTMEFRK